MAEPHRPPKYRFFIREDFSAMGRVRRLLGAARPVPRFPRVVQIQTRTGCNADCCFCPYGETADVVPKGAMDQEIFERLLEECRRHRVRRISPYLMNEPFVDKHLLDRVATIRRLAPSSRVTITTNGEPMVAKVVDRMLDQGGVDRIYVSVQGIDPVKYEQTMRGPKLSRVIDNVLHLQRELDRRGLSRPRLTVTMVDTAYIDVEEARQFWEGHGVAVKSTRLENRGGNIDLEPGGESMVTRPMTSFVNCSRLMRQAYVLHDGRVTLCCTDYHQTTILGDLREQSMYEIWNGERATNIRRNFIAGDLEDNPLCRACTIAERVPQ